jgi:hypothetical protein
MIHQFNNKSGPNTCFALAFDGSFQFLGDNVVNNVQSQAGSPWKKTGSHLTVNN